MKKLSIRRCRNESKTTECWTGVAVIELQRNKQWIESVRHLPWDQTLTLCLYHSSSHCTTHRHIRTRSSSDLLPPRLNSRPTFSSSLSLPLLCTSPSFPVIPSPSHLVFYFFIFHLFLMRAVWGKIWAIGFNLRIKMFSFSALGRAVRRDKKKS